MWKKLKALWQMFRRSFVYPVLKSAVIASFLMFITIFVIFGAAKIDQAPIGYEHFIGQRVYQTWLKSMPWLFPWHVARVTIQTK